VARRNSSPYDISAVGPNRPGASADLYDTASRLREGFCGSKVEPGPALECDEQLAVSRLLFLAESHYWLLLLWCERGDDFFEARIAPERVPEGMQF
jgi:hypothetical protein